jgi:O-methyltransferase
MAPTSRRHAREILGAPLVPPPRLTRLVTAVRRGLLGAHRRSAPPSLRVLEAVFGLFDNRVLGLLVELDVPELLDSPRSAAELAGATGTDADALDRVLRYAAGRGLVGWGRDGRYRANDLTNVLRRDNVNSWRGWVEFGTSDWFWDAWRHAGAAVRGGTSGMEAATGHPFFEYVTAVRPEAGRAFNDAMRAGSVLQAVALDHGLDWRGVRTVCDVGGGTGGALRYLLEANDHLEGTLFDLPEVVADADPALLRGALASRARTAGGSFFDTVPAGRDRYLLLAIVHDWDDQKATEILRNVAAALPPHGEVVIVENVLPDAPADDFAFASDLLMLVLASGRERTQAQFDRLFTDAGLILADSVPLATGFNAFRLRRAANGMT